METAKINAETLAFSKNALNVSFDALNAISDQAVVATDLLLAAAPAVPEEGKKVVSLYFKESQKALVNLKKHLEGGLELDLTAKDAPVKSLEALESFYNDAFSQAANIKKEAKSLVDNAAKQLPKEAKSVIAFWNDAFTFGFDSFQNYVNTNFEVAKKVTSEVSVSNQAAKQKAAK
jgi:hypothetical protein